MDPSNVIKIYPIKFDFLPQFISFTRNQKKKKNTFYVINQKFSCSFDFIKIRELYLRKSKDLHRHFARKISDSRDGSKRATSNQTNTLRSHAHLRAVPVHISPPRGKAKNSGGTEIRVINDELDLYGARGDTFDRHFTPLFSRK